MRLRTNARRLGTLGARSLACVLGCAAVLGTSGCAELFRETASTPAPTAVIRTAVPTPEPTIAPTPFSMNPLHAFYNTYTLLVAERLDAFQNELFEDGTSALFDYATMLCEHRLLLTDARVSVGLLTEDSTDYYTGTLTGAACGTGTLMYQNGGYVMDFTYDDGSVLWGVFRDNDLQYTITDAEGVLVQKSHIFLSDNAWLSVVERGGQMSVLSFGDTIRFAAFAPSTGFYDEAAATLHFADVDRLALAASATATTAPVATASPEATDASGVPQDAEPSPVPASLPVTRSEFELLTWEATELVLYDANGVSVVETGTAE